MKNKKSFIFFHSWKEQVDLMTDIELRNFINNLIRFNEGEEPQLNTREEKLIWSGIIYSLNHNKEHWEEVKEKRRAAGKLGGAPIGNSNASKDKNNQNNQKQPKQTKQPVNVNDNVNVNVNVNDNVNTGIDIKAREEEISKLIRKYRIHYAGLSEGIKKMLPTDDYFSELVRAGKREDVLQIIKRNFNGTFRNEIMELYEKVFN